MKITKIKIKNFRLLKKFELDLEDNLSLVIGKNNCGKTSLLSILDKFIGSQSTSNQFSFDDFNSELKDELKAKVESDDDRGYFGISLKLFIEYDNSDDLSNIGNSVIMDLDPDNKTIVLAFEYKLDDLQKLINDYSDFKIKENTKPEEIRKDFFYFMKINHKDYFSLYIKSVKFNNITKVENDNIFIDLKKEKVQIDKIINFKMIDARRNVSNKEPEKSLSSLSSKIYKKVEASEEEKEGIEKFKDALIETDGKLNNVYENIFSEVLDDVKKFGGIRPDDTNIKIISTLQHRDLLDGNTTVMYSINEDHELPENYNGLGYMNLISMIFEIKILIHEFKRELSEKPADINLLFIEEPEAHTHPQMQYIFIENIKSLLDKGIERSDGQNRKLQTIISTHSSHIASKSDFNDIKYFKKENNQVISKNLKDLENEYEDNGEEQNYKFLKQYLTLHRAELFFADKAIFIEGDTERILLPAMMKKIDQEDEGDSLPLLSQNISIVEVGAYAHIFEKFIDFIGVKSLVVTDIDSAKEDRNKCQVTDADAQLTTNASLVYFYDENTLTFYIGLTLENKRLLKDQTTKQWMQNENGHLMCIYQIEEDSYHARSFEDAFFHINKRFLQENLEKFKEGIKNPRFINPEHQNYVDDAYVWAEKCVDKKPALAMEILLNSATDEHGNQFSNWKIPTYIKEGLLWLKEN
jgi:predicted ATP-dependent endonuclease of OLD family